MLRVFFLFLIVLLFVGKNSGQVADTTKALNPLKLGLVAGTGGAFYAGTLTSLYAVWYQGKRPTNFHLTNDNPDWKQIDKWGHMYTCYAMGKMGMQSLHWAGVKDKKAIFYGGSFGVLFMTSIEVLDGHYEEWGASPMDMVANASGGLLLIGQELAWKKQIVTMKFSYHHTELSDLRPGVLGATPMERLVHDYNGQTFWFSTNLKSVFSNSSSLPKWLNIAPGYGAYGMLSSHERNVYGQQGELLPNFNHTRHYYLSLDIDLDKIRTNSKVLKTAFFFLNMLKVPMPTFEVDNQGNTTFHWIYF